MSSWAMRDGSDKKILMYCCKYIAAFIGDGCAVWLSVIKGLSESQICKLVLTFSIRTFYLDIAAIVSEKIGRWIILSSRLSEPASARCVFSKFEFVFEGITGITDSDNIFHDLARAIFHDGFEGVQIFWCPSICQDWCDDLCKQTCF